MSDSAIFELGSRVYCSDADCGELLQFVVEPDVPRLTDLVVCSVGGGARLVAASFARPTAYGVLLDCDRREFNRLPAARVRDPEAPPVTPATPSLPDAQTRIRRGDHVQALDGDAGRVLGLVVRSADGAITHVLVTAGHLWHRKHVAVPVDYVAGLGFAGLDLLLTRQHVAEFPLV
ncbi:hypothetical protein ABH920_005570 [Catenulispora sp. EB89]|uniref:hypothetical protein n=1 Tax=Catenulispora sp. EB89 TaxID=3156257 RepID=UPI0035159303